MHDVIYIVEDEPAISELIGAALSLHGYQTERFEQAEDLLARMQQGGCPHLILCDIMLPGMDGIELVKRLRAEKKTARLPILLLTAKGSEIDKVNGLDAGADDYIVKPFGMLELGARVRAALRTHTPQTQLLRWGKLELDDAHHAVLLEGHPVELTLKEYEVLRLLMASDGRVVPRQTFLEQVWGYNFEGESRTLDMHIRTLRGKLGDEQHLIETIRGIGYRLAAIQ